MVPENPTEKCFRRSKYSYLNSNELVVPIGRQPKRRFELGYPEKSLPLVKYAPNMCHISFPWRRREFKRSFLNFLAPRFLSCLTSQVHETMLNTESAPVLKFHVLLVQNIYSNKPAPILIETGISQICILLMQQMQNTCYREVSHSQALSLPLVNTSHMTRLCALYGCTDELFNIVAVLFNVRVHITALCGT
jgi:hypothetical protein